MPSCGHRDDMLGTWETVCLAGAHLAWFLDFVFPPC